MRSLTMKHTTQTFTFFMDNDKNALPVPIYACMHSTMSNIPIQHNVECVRVYAAI